MKKLFVLLLMIPLLIVFVGCEDKDPDPITISMGQIKNAITKVMDAHSYELNILFKLVTEELEIEVFPLFKMEYLKKDEYAISRLSYCNKIMLGMNKLPIELIIDEETQMVYFNDSVGWAKQSIESLMNQPSISDLEFDAIREIYSLTEILKDVLVNFSAFTYYGEHKEGDVTLLKFGVNYNMFEILNVMYNQLNDNNRFGFENFLDFFRSMSLERFVTLFEEIELHLYLEKTLVLSKIKIDFVPLLNKLYIIFGDEMDTRYPEYDIATMLGYVKTLEIGVTFTNVGYIEDIIIPTQALEATQLIWVVIVE